MADQRLERLLAQRLERQARIRQQNKAAQQRFRRALIGVPLYLGAGALAGHLLAALANAGYPRAAWTALLTLCYLGLVGLLAGWWGMRRRR